MKTLSGVTIIIPACNEEKNIRSAIKSVVGAVKRFNLNYEILVIDDGSSDNTDIEAQKEKAEGKIRIIRLGAHKGLGYAIRKGIEQASMEYVSVFPGDNDMDPQSLAQIIKQKNEADLIIAYLGKSDTRKLLRRVASLAYVGLVSKLFKINLQYFNGPFICQSRLLKKLKLISTGFTIYAELKIRLIKDGYSYKEIQFLHKGRVHGKSKALNLSSIADVLWATFLILKDLGVR